MFSAFFWTWPPVPVPATQASGGRFDSLKRTDGTLELTYDGWPLYTYLGDGKPGDTKDDNLRGVWHAVRSEQMSRSKPRIIGDGGY